MPFIAHLRPGVLDTVGSLETFGPTTRGVCPRRASDWPAPHFLVRHFQWAQYNSNFTKWAGAADSIEQQPTRQSEGPDRAGLNLKVGHFVLGQHPKAQFIAAKSAKPLARYFALDSRNFSCLASYK